MRRNNLTHIILTQKPSKNFYYVLRKTKCRHLEISVFYNGIKTTAWLRTNLETISKLPLTNVSRETLFKKQLYKDLQKGGYNGH